MSYFESDSHLFYGMELDDQQQAFVQARLTSLGGLVSLSTLSTSMARNGLRCVSSPPTTGVGCLSTPTS
jgi:hypothetical protein